eukprot:gene1847-16340_t
MAAKSKRYSDFDETSRKRYDEQISIINGIDPYTLKKSQLSSEFENFPHITYPDIVDYLPFAPSHYSRADLKNFRSLESYNHFVCGWVRDVGESCFHVAAVLFYLEFLPVRIQGNKTVTQDKAYWMPPTLKEVEYSEIKDIDFMS